MFPSALSHYICLCPVVTHIRVPLTNRQEGRDPCGTASGADWSRTEWLVLFPVHEVLGRLRNTSLRRPDSSSLSTAQVQLFLLCVSCSGPAVPSLCQLYGSSFPYSVSAVQGQLSLLSVSCTGQAVPFLCQLYRSNCPFSVSAVQVQLFLLCVSCTGPAVPSLRKLYRASCPFSP